MLEQSLLWISVCLDFEGIFVCASMSHLSTLFGYFQSLALSQEALLQSLKSVRSQKNLIPGFALVQEFSGLVEVAGGKAFSLCSVSVL